jgi:hypothetical protein
LIVIINNDLDPHLSVRIRGSNYSCSTSLASEDSAALRRAALPERACQQKSAEKRAAMLWLNDWFDGHSGFIFSS